MKKTLSVLLATVMLFALIPFSELDFSVFAADVTDEQGVKYLSRYDLDYGGSYYEVIVPSDNTNTNIVIPETINGLPVKGICTIRWCDNLQTIYIPSSVVYIYEGAFDDSGALENITVDENNEHYCSEDGVLFNKGKTTLIKYPPAKPDLYYSVPNSVVRIERTSFWATINLQDLYMMDSVEFIGYRAFAWSEVENVSLSDNLKNIDDEAFAYCTKLKRLDLPNSVVSIGDLAFAGLYSMTEIFIPASIASMGATVFENWADVQTIYCEVTSSPLTWSRYWRDNSSAKVVWGKIPDANQIKSQIGDLDISGSDISGAEIELLGYKFPLINLSSEMKLDIGKNVHIIFEGTKAKVLVGFDENYDANIQGSSNKDVYWSEAYREVKSLYTGVTGKKVDTTRLWNDFSKLRGKLKKTNGTMMINVGASLAGYMEFDFSNGSWVFKEGGVIASLEAGVNLKHSPVPPAPIYIIYGINGSINGQLKFVQEEKIIPQFASDLKLELSAGINVGVGSTYVQGEVYGALMGQIDTANKEKPLRLGIDVGARWEGYLFGFELFADSVSFADIELYPDFGTEWSMEKLNLTPNVDVSEVNSYKELINSAEPIDRSYLASAYSLRRSSVSFIGADFVKNNAYPLSSPNLVSFDNGNMLLVWVDDNGTKTQENMCTLMYSYYNGTEWSTPEAIYEDGTNNDMPTVYSDGRYAYIAWQKATTEFAEGTETSEMLESFDLYATVFDSETASFGDNIAINPEEDSDFEMNAIIRGENGKFVVAWTENSDNNIYQLSGSNSLYQASVDANGILTSTVQIISTEAMFNDLELAENGVYYSLFETDKTNLYCYNGSNNILVFEGINCFEEENGCIYYTDASGFYTYNGTESVQDISLGALDDFVVESNGSDLVMFATVLNEDFTKALYYSKYSVEDGEWGRFELYSDEGKYIRNYSPAMLPDGSVRVAFNYISEDESGVESASIVVGECTDETDVRVSYVDFDEDRLETGNVDFNIGVENYSSAVIESFEVTVTDSEGNIAHSETVTQTLAPFGEGELSVNLDIPEGYTNEVYTFTVMPVGISDHSIENNSTQTTFERILIPADYSAYNEAVSKAAALNETDYTAKSWQVLAEALSVDVSGLLDIEQEEVDAATMAINDAIDALVKGIKGDVNDDGRVLVVDYMLLKRYCLDTYKLNDAQKARADVNGDGNVTVVDYMLLKRYCLGTYEIK